MLTEHQTAIGTGAIGIERCRRAASGAGQLAVFGWNQVFERIDAALAIEGFGPLIAHELSNSGNI